MDIIPLKLILNRKNKNVAVTSMKTSEIKKKKKKDGLRKYCLYKYDTAFFYRHDKIHLMIIFLISLH